MSWLNTHHKSAIYLQAEESIDKRAILPLSRIFILLTLGFNKSNQDRAIQ